MPSIVLFRVSFQGSIRVALLFYEERGREACMNKLVLKMIVVLMILCFSPASAFCWMCRYVKAISGDTVIIGCDDNEFIVRLYGIDAPDIGSIDHEKSRNHLDEIMRSNQTYVVGQPTSRQRTDRYGRHVAILYKDNICVNERMVADGMAFVYPGECNSPKCTQWKQLEKIAADNRSGIWFLGGDEKPWLERQKNADLAQNDSGYFEDVYYFTEEKKDITIVLKNKKIIHPKVVVATETELPKQRFFIEQPRVVKVPAPYPVLPYIPLLPPQ